MNEKKLIKLLKRKNTDGLKILMEDYSGILNSVISRTLSSFPFLVEEVLNETIFAIWENINYYDSSRSSFKNYLASIARYKAIDLLRKEVKHNSYELLEDKTSYSDDEFNKLLIKEIFNYLSEEDRKLFTMLFVDGISYDELSRDLKKSKNALYSKVKRIRKKLNEEFNGG